MKPIRKILIANRAEIAIRILKAAREMGKKAVAVYAHDDRFLPHVFQADEAYLLEGKSVAETYLNIDQILEVARKAKADAIHPGYGFLAENAAFCRACQKEGLVFIGPSAESIQKMGEKIAAKEAMKNAGVSVIPGSDGALSSFEEAKKIASEIGFPVLLKAVFGGGGRGMRKIDKAEELRAAYDSASREAESAFGDGSLYLERFFEKARHIEVQILADHYGNVIHLGERECSIQRRHQKLCEEAPANRLNQVQRKKLWNQAVAGARAIGYRNAGTMEFVLDEKGEFYFMEMNTRIQVEHPVTECITGVDLVQQQIKIAEGEKLKIKQEDVTFRGHAIEFRINAEDPYRNFLPAPGKVMDVVLPAGSGIRVDTFLYPYVTIPFGYDSLIAKLIVWADTRALALKRAKLALEDFHIRGVPTTIPFHAALINEKWFQKGDMHTQILTEQPVQLPRKVPEEVIAAIAFALYHSDSSALNHRPLISHAWKNAARCEGARNLLE